MGESGNALFWLLQLLLGSGVVVWLTNKLKAIPFVGAGITPFIVGILASGVGLGLNELFTVIGQPTNLDIMEILKVTTGQNVVLSSVIFEAWKKFKKPS